MLIDLLESSKAIGLCPMGIKASLNLQQNIQSASYTIAPPMICESNF